MNYFQSRLAIKSVGATTLMPDLSKACDNRRSANRPGARLAELVRSESFGVVDEMTAPCQTDAAIFGCFQLMTGRDSGGTRSVVKLKLSTAPAGSG